MKKKAAAKKSPATADKKAMVVMCTGERPMHEVAHDLKSAGFEVDGVLDAIRQVTGSAEPGLKGKLEGIRGVHKVHDAGPDVQIPSHDSPVQ